MAVGPILDRDEELAAIDGALASVANGTQVLLLEGEAGLGKTTLWQEAIRRAESRGFRLLATRAGQSETRLTFVGLADLFGRVGAEAFEAPTSFFTCSSCSTSNLNQGITRL